MVNEFLNIIEPLSPSWIAVTPKNNDRAGVTGKNIRGVKEVLSTLSGGDPVGFFPSGAVSDLKLKDMAIRDRKWQEPLIRLIRKASVPIVPIRFFDHNSTLFYLLGLINWKIRTLRLPREVINKAGKMVRIVVGSPISVEEQDNVKDLDAFSSLLRASVYDIPTPEPSDFTKRSALSI